MIVLLGRSREALSSAVEDVGDPESGALELWGRFWQERNGHDGSGLVGCSSGVSLGSSTIVLLWSLVAAEMVYVS